jgi:Na+/H+-dicarboxylate symporter
MQIVHMLMVVAPVGIGALIAGRLGAAGGFAHFWGEVLRLSKYTGCVLAALAIHALILFLILWFVGRPKVGPFKFLAGVAESLLTAMSTSSSSAALPVTMECVIEKNQISERTASFVVPLGATINMNGTALYEAIAAVFIAQLYGIDLGTGQLLVVFITATLAAVGAAGIPEAGLVTMVIVLKAVDLPLEGISLILMIDWFLDRIRTTVNVWSDTVGTAVIERLT